MNPIRLGLDRELFWDNYLIDTSRTSAEIIQHRPDRKEVVMTFDRPWEGDGCNYFSMVRDGDLYRMYYLAWEMFDENMTQHTTQRIRVCTIESRDGIRWYRPNLGICLFDGSPENNILLDESMGLFDNFTVFLDENPECPSEERYKATSKHGDALWCYVSADGYLFRKAWVMTEHGAFDTQNVAFWSQRRDFYYCYIRDYHDYVSRTWPAMNDGVRDIRVMTSKDFKQWTEPKPLDFGDAEDISLYTNAVFQYPNATQMLVGMPSRYVERRAWNNNFEQLTGAEARKRRMAVCPRYGLTTTDCVLMISRDGFRWKRQDEAWITPGIECADNWVYGDCYPAPGLFLTPSDLDGAPAEFSTYCYERHWSQKPARLRRYTLRQDGFFSCHAGFAKKVVMTKPILYEGGTLHLNFSTSAMGCIRVTITDRNKAFSSCELFGDTLDRTIHFSGDLSCFIGREIILQFSMSDADLYSMWFATEAP